MITALQLGQFCSGGAGFSFFKPGHSLMWFMGLGYIQEGVKEFWDDDYKRFSWWVTYDYVGILIMMFTHFYHKNYIVPRRKKNKTKVS